MDDRPNTRYVKSDDVHIAYQVFGEGSLDLVFVPGFVSNIDTIWQSPDHSAFFRRLGSFCRVILFDKRGTGMSDRGSQIFTLEQRMHDVQAVLDEVGSERAALFGISEGGPMSLLYAASYMAEHISGAKLIELAGIDHNYSMGDRDALLDQIELFLTGARHAHEPERVLATVLFIDISGSTERAAGMGDRAWRGVLEAFY